MKISEVELMAQIDLYLEGKLSGEELAAFERRRLTDADFAQMIENQRFANELIMDAGLLEVKAKLQAIHARHKPKTWGRWVAVGSLLLGAAGGLYWLTSSKKPSDSIVFSQLSEDHTLSQVLTNREASTQKIQGHHKPAKLSPQLFSNQAIDNQDNTNKSEEFATVVSSDEILSIPTPAEEKEVADNQTVVPNLSGHTSSPQSAPCFSEGVSVLFRSEPSCASSFDGKIILQPKGLAGKLKFALGKGADYQTSPIFVGLSPGLYFAYVQTEQGCVYEVPDVIEVQALDCYSNEFAFAPDRGEVWNVPYDRPALLLIFNSVGIEVFRQQLDGSRFEWNGQNHSGISLPMGAYRYTIRRYDTGAESTGVVTIIR